MTTEQTDINIRNDYNVTDKADGLRMLGLVDKEGELFMVDMSFKVYKTNYKNPKCRNSLLDGEYITKSKEGKFIQRLLFFDIYLAPGSKDVSTLPFKAENGVSRYDAMNSWLADWNSDTRKLIKTVNLTIGLKQFDFAKGADIFEKAKHVLGRSSTHEYHTDGLIFTPNNLGLPGPGDTFREQFKWKPSKDNTVDFLITFEKEVDDPSKEVITTGIHPGTKETLEYKNMRLFVGSSRDTSLSDPRKTILYKLPIEKSKKGDYKPILFSPSEFPDTMASVSFVKVYRDEHTNEFYAKTEDDEPIRDRSIVEMRYDPKQPPGWRWIPLRVRADKTERFLKGQIGRTLNSEKVAESVWSSINRPITDYMITTGNEFPSEAERREMSAEVNEAERTAKVLQKSYFERKPMSQDETKVLGLRLFHRLYIRGQILYKAVFHGTDGKKLLDLAVGEGQDLPRWLEGKAGFVFGIDYSGPSITKPIKGAYGRLLGQKIQTPIFFAIVDSSKPIRSGEAGLEELDKSMMKSIFGGSADLSIPLVEEMGVGQLQDGADSVLCMFALHYFFDKEETFNGLLKNISETLKIGGYFVGANFDGDAVFNFLRGTKTHESIRGEDDKSVLWEITKEYESDELPQDSSVFGMAVDVEFISIGAKHREYLVPFEFLKKKMATIGCELVTADELAQIGLKNSTSMFDVSFDMSKKNRSFKFDMSDVVKQFSFLNRWYIFKRTSSGIGSAEPSAEKVAVDSESVAPSVAELAPGSVEPGAPGSVEPGAPVVTGSVAQGAPVVTAKKRTLKGLAPLATVVEGSPTATEFMTSVVSGGPAAAQQMQARLTAAAVAGNMEAAKALDKEAVALGAKAVEGPPGSVAQAFIQAETFPVERTADLQKVFATASLFKISEKAQKKNAYLTLPAGYESYASRHMAPNARFRIRDSTDPADTTQYPSITHFLAGMKFKYASKQPDLAQGFFSSEGSIHKQYAVQRNSEVESARGRKISAERDLEILMNETDQVKLDEARLIKTKAVGFDKTLWDLKMNELLKAAIEQRLRSDKWFCIVVDAAQKQSKKFLYENSEDMVLGGTHSVDRKIKGENRYGSFIEELAASMPDVVRACKDA
jgi:SAM-dependent methyltransferase